MALLTAAFASLTAPPSFARDDDSERREAVRRAVEAGEVLPLSKILETVRVKVPGDITGIEINREEGRWHYELRVIDPRGRVLEVHVDAHSGNIEEIEAK
ncbi:PepSY domain-containing protein [Bradyrhizobium sp. USDA 3256]